MRTIARRATAPVFALTLFSSAALVFVLQPMFARMVTPLLGGSAAIWNVSMAFFQAALLIGYLYAHLLARLNDLRLQAGLHAGILLFAALALPVHVSGAFGPPSSAQPALWLTGVLAFSVGAPFAAASATAPLLQSWYVRSGRTDAHDPYYLYAASNLGSFTGLLAYPILIEPLLGTRAQSVAWQAGYATIVVLILLAATAALIANGPLEGRTGAREKSPPPGWERRFYWMGAAAAPSALVLGVTLHISTDVASAPLLWVLPLALYLLTFVIAFARGTERITPVARFFYPLTLIFLIVSYCLRTIWLAMLLGNLAGFFISALLCHLALSRSRPDAGRLTEFYFFISLGGVLGGAFAAFLAPVIFNNVYEYPLALAATACFLPRGEAASSHLPDYAAAAVAIVALVSVPLLGLKPGDAAVIAGSLGSAATLAAAAWRDKDLPSLPRHIFIVSVIALAASIIYAGVYDHGRRNYVSAAALGFCVAALFFNRTRPAALSVLILVSFAIIFFAGGQAEQIITQKRGFFGVLRTREIRDPDSPRTPLLRVLTHGNTIHGAQLTTHGLTRQPLTYYNPRTALGEAILAGLSMGEPSSVALIGLGAGSTACLIRPTDRLTIFEIDPAVVRLSASPGGDFTCVPECQPDARIIVGDARLRISEEPDGEFDVIIVDAFSSDAIPAHLLTREALALYLRKTSDRGVVILHLSSLNLALAPEAARVARDLGAPALFRVSERFNHPYASYYGGMPAIAMIVVKSSRVLEQLPLPAMSADWRLVGAPPGRAWSDDYINIARALWENFKIKRNAAPAR
jgi:hypothetical protein